MRDLRLTAVTRFGLGPRRGEIVSAGRDPRNYVEAQCEARNAADVVVPATIDIGAAREAYRRYRTGVRDARRLVREDASPENVAAEKAIIQEQNGFHRGILLSELEARYATSIQSAYPFVERLALFWSNHFAINIDANLITRFTGSLYEREALRPHVLGSFADLLKAAIKHPAMLGYLDNYRSVGPNSRQASRARRPLDINENLARELLELHTLGVDGGYTQDDVIETAKLLTGWTGGFTLRRRYPVFDERFHEPGSRTILGVTYPEAGEEQLDWLLDDLSVHPATARFLSTKLARHFVGDDVNPSLIDKLSGVFLDTGGDLAAVSLALVRSDEAWAGEATKFVPPYDFMVSSGRVLGLRRLKGRQVDRSARILAQQIWRTPSPAGWPDDDSAFSGGDALMERVDFAENLAGRRGVRDVIGLANETFADALDIHVEQGIRRAESPQQALVLLLMSPALQRR